MIRFQKKLIELEDAAIISGNQSEYHIISSVSEQVKQSKKGMGSEFKQQLKIQMHAREVSSFSSWSQYLKFVTSVQRAVHSESDSSQDDASMKKVRSLKIPVGERKTPKDLFPNSLLTKDSEWPEDKGDCVFDFNNVQCPYGDKCFRTHVKNPKSSPSSAATNGSNSPKMQAIEKQMRRLSAQKERLQLEEEECGSHHLSSSSEEDGPHKVPPYRFPPSSSRSSGSKN